MRDVTVQEPQGPDATTVTVVRKHLDNIVAEMGRAMIRTAYSPIFSESQDFSCMLFSRGGEMISQAEMNPAIVCAALRTVPATIDELGVESFRPGDVVIQNDPYRGSCHMPEHMLLRPLFQDSELIGFAANIAHLAEIGGMAAGSFAANARELFQEGLRLVPVKLMAEGEYVQDVWRIILGNHRTPKATYGDLHAMMASLLTAERRMQRIVGKYGIERFDRIADELLAYGERWMRQQLATLPPGEYTCEDCMEDDGVSEEPVVFRVRAVIEGSEAIIDWTGTDPQSPGPTNCTYVVAMAASYTGLLQALHAKDVPLNGGTFRPVKVIAPVGSAVNVAFPGASVNGNTEMAPKLIEAVQGALASAMPASIGAASGATSMNFLCGGVHPETNEYFTLYLLDGVGWGGRSGQDGNSAQLNPNGNLCSNTPVEVVESRYPWRVMEYSLRPDSGGAGEYRGGLGLKRVLVVLASEVTVSMVTDRTRVAPRGLAGGHAGACGAVLVRQRDAETFRTFKDVFGTPSQSKFSNVTLHRGDEVMLLSPGGGGWGDPLARDPRRVLDDVRSGYVSREMARSEYGVELSEAPGSVDIDEPRTRARREAGRGRLE